MRTIAHPLVWRVLLGLLVEEDEGDGEEFDEEAAPLLPTPVSQSIARGMRQVRNNAAQEHMNAQGMHDASECT